MTQQATKTIRTNESHNLTVEVDYKVPGKGDELRIFGTSIILTEDMVPKADYIFVDGKYKVQAALGKSGSNFGNIVFVGNGYTWRKGEFFKAV
jgi:hypothetical protein